MHLPGAHLVLLCPFVPFQLLFHTAHPPFGKNSCTPLKGLCFGHLFGFPSTFLPASVPHSSSQTCIPPANNMSLPSEPLLTRQTSWMPGQSFGFVFFFLFPHPVFPCHKDYICSVFLQSHRQGRLVWQWLWVLLHVGGPQVVPPGARVGVKAMSWWKCTAEAVAVSLPFLFLAANVQELC